MDAGVAAEEEVGLRAAVVKVDITPTKPVRMSGYAGRKEESTGVHDPLSLRVTVFENGDTRLVLVSADLIGFYGAGEAFRQAICERYGLQPSELFLAGIHTHSGPTPTLSEDGFANNVEYTKEPAGANAWKRWARPSERCARCRLAIGRGYSPVGVNRRERTPDNRHQAGTQSERADGQGSVGSEDWPTPTARQSPRCSTMPRTQRHLGRATWSISGDVLGLASQFVEKVLASGGRSRRPSPAPSGRHRSLVSSAPGVRHRKRLDARAGSVGNALGYGSRARLSGHQDRGLGCDHPNGNRNVGACPASRQVAGENEPATRPLCVTAARIGDVAFVGLGCELLTEVGMAIKAASPYPNTFIITHCNGSAGYLPPKHLYEEGGYEIDSTRFAPEAAEILVKEAQKMLEALK